ncbi:MAG: 4Fe-4S binding protein [Chloroflexota bacterium]
MIDLSVNLAGLELKNPLIVASSDNTRDVRQVKQAEACGAGAVVLKGALPPGRIGLQSTLRLYPDYKTGAMHGHAGAKRVSFDQALEVVKAAKKETTVKIGVNTAMQSYDDLETATDFCRRAVQAGADFIEIHFSPQIPVHSMVNQTEEEYQQQRGKESQRAGIAIRELPNWVTACVKSIKGAVDVPMIAKINAEGINIVGVSKVAEEAGVDILNPGAPGCGTIQMDIYHGGSLIMPGARTACLHTVGSPWKPYAEGIVARVAQAVRVPVIGGGGLMNWRDAVEMFMLGAGAVSFCTLLMMYGYEALTRVRRGLVKFMEDQGYERIDDFRGLALKSVAPSFPDCDIVPSVAVVDAEKCTGCGRCLKLAACLAITLENGIAVVNGPECLGCGICTLVCPTEALSMVETAPSR